MVQQYTVGRPDFGAKIWNIRSCIYIHTLHWCTQLMPLAHSGCLLGLFLSLKCLAGSGRVLHSGRFDQFFVRFLRYSHWSESTGQKIVNWTTVHTLCTTTTSVHNEAVARLVTTYYYSRTGDVIRKTLGLSWPQKINGKIPKNSAKKTRQNNGDENAG